MPPVVTMSLLNVWVSPERALVAVDTDGMTPGGPHFGMSKLLPLVHAQTVFAGRGDRRFLWDLFSRYHLANADVDYDAIIDSLPQLLASVIAGLRQDGYAPFDYQFAIVGWSPVQQRVSGRWYVGRTDDDGYDVDELGARVAPWQDTEAARVPDSHQNIRWLAERQVSWLRAEGAAGGGDLLVTEVSKDQLTIQRIDHI